MRLSALATPSYTLEKAEPICPTSCLQSILICLWHGRLTPSWRMLTRMLQHMRAGICARVWNVAYRTSGILVGVSSSETAGAGARMPLAADAATHRGRTMSRSNPMHHATPPRPHPWPFPVTLPAPGHAPGPRPARAPVPYPANAPAAPF